MSVLIAPMVVPIVVVGVSTYLFFAPLGLVDSYTGLIIVHAALGAPFVLTTVLATLQGFNQNLVRASLSLGANPLTTFFRVTLPVIAPGVISGALFAFATSFDEVVVTLFLAGPDQVTLPRQMFTGIRENITPTIAAVATLLILFTTTLAARRWSGCAAGGVEFANDRAAQPAPERQRDAALRRPGDDDAAACRTSAAGLDAAFVGVPLDIGTSNRAGARFGPRQIRAESALLRPYNMATGAAPFDTLQVADLGDVPINTYSLDKSLAIIDALLRRRARRRLPAADARRRPHHRPADPARRREAGTGRSRWCTSTPTPTSTTRCSASRVAHGTPFRRAVEEGLAGLRQGLADRPARHRLRRRRLRLAAPTGLHRRAGARGRGTARWRR